MEPVKILMDRLEGMGESLIALLPQIVMALIFLAVTWGIVRFVQYLFDKATRRSHMRRSLKVLFGKLIAIGIWIVGLLIAATIAFPTLQAGDLIAGLGIGSLAIGLAFKDIFENFVAGILILLREPMRIGDFVECEEAEGAVESITIRDTYLRQSDGQLVIMPNAMMFKNPVFIRTDKDLRRTTVICGVAYGEDVDQARDVIRDAVKGLDSVNAEKPVQVFAQEFADSSINFEVTWWTGSKPREIRESRDQVVAAVKSALDDAGIEIPFPYRTLTFKQPLALNRAEDSGGAGETGGKNGGKNGGRAEKPDTADTRPDTA